MKSPGRNATLSICALALWPASGHASDADWQKVQGDAVRTALSGRILQYEDAWQDFRASGRTLYNAGSESWGYWRVEGDQYCSQWPPSDLWACYDLEASGDKLRFVGDEGDTTEATYAD
ncbi:MAG: hypothetical protein WBC93_22985 [Sulfitobacter sp.]